MCFTPALPFPELCQGAQGSKREHREPGALGSALPCAPTTGVPVVHQCRVHRVWRDRKEGQQLLLQALQHPLQGTAKESVRRGQIPLRGDGVPCPSCHSPGSSTPHSQRTLPLKKYRPRQQILGFPHPLLHPRSSKHSRRCRTAGRHVAVRPRAERNPALPAPHFACQMLASFLTSEVAIARGALSLPSPPLLTAKVQLECSSPEHCDPRDKQQPQLRAD